MLWASPLFVWAWTGSRENTVQVFTQASAPLQLMDREGRESLGLPWLEYNCVGLKPARWWDGTMAKPGAEAVKGGQ